MAQNFIKAIDATLLNQMMMDFGVCDRPVVSAVTVTPAPFLPDGETDNALFFELGVTFKPGTTEDMPRNMIMKVCRNVFGTAERETYFYNMVSRDGPLSEVVRCFGSQWLVEDDVGLILLEYVTELAITHDEPLPENILQYRNAMHALAGVHARWWNHASLGEGEMTNLWSEEWLTAIMQLVRDGVDKYARDSPDALSARQKETVNLLLEFLQPVLLEHTRSARSLCVVHGDAGLWNFVLPVDARSPARVLDFQLWNVNLPAWDVAYMIPLLWPTDIRRRFEAELYSTYLAALGKRGIQYEESAFWQDLRVCTAATICLAFANYATGLWNAEHTRDRVQQSLDAFEDYNCIDTFHTLIARIKSR